MKVKLSEAVKIFFSNSSLEMVFFEAISNSLDAEATKIDIDISIESFSQPETLTIEIKGLIPDWISLFLISDSC